MVIGVVAAVVLMVPAVASAQDDPSNAQYQPSGQQIGGEVAGGGGGGGGGEGGGPGAPAGDAGGFNQPVVSGLPFTGFDVLAMVLAAAAITATGFTLRRLSRPPTA
jgi:hypothetical protein